MCTEWGGCSMGGSSRGGGGGTSTGSASRSGLADRGAGGRCMERAAFYGQVSGAAGGCRGGKKGGVRGHATAERGAGNEARGRRWLRSGCMLPWWLSAVNQEEKMRKDFEAVTATVSDSTAGISWEEAETRRRMDDMAFEATYLKCKHQNTLSLPHLYQPTQVLLPLCSPAQGLVAGAMMWCLQAQSYPVGGRTLLLPSARLQAIARLSRLRQPHSLHTFSRTHVATHLRCAGL